MVTYTKEQNELVKEIRRLQQNYNWANHPKGFNYEESIRFGELQEQAKTQNLCWW